MKESCLNFEKSTMIYESSIQKKFIELMFRALFSIEGRDSPTGRPLPLSEVRSNQADDAIYRDYEMLLVFICRIILEHPQLVKLDLFLAIYDESKFYKEYRNYFLVQNLI